MLPPRSTLFPYTTLFRSKEEPQLPVKIRLSMLTMLGAVFLAASVGGFAQQPSQADSTPIRTKSPLSDRSRLPQDRKSTRLNSSHRCISYAVFCLKKYKNN